jgi:tetratricopeptide (TPR) repeat protein
METVVTETTKEYGLIVVGYSGRDDSIMSALEDADISGNRLYWCVRRPREHHDADTVEEKISDRAAKLVRESDGRVVPIEGFNSLMSRFRQLVEGLSPVTEKDELQNRFEQRVAQIDDILEERSEANTSEAEEEELSASELSNWALEALEQGNYERAKSMYSHLINNDRKSATRFGNRGAAKVWLGEYSEAIEDYEKAIEADPNYSNAYNDMGVVENPTRKL